MKKFFVFLLILLLILGGVGFWGYQKLTEFVHTPVNVTQDQLLTIERGTTGSKLTAAQQSESGDLFFNGRENLARFIEYD